MSRTKIAYVNFHFFDTDVTVVKELQKAFDVEWHVILRERDEAYTQEFFKRFVEGTGIRLHLYPYTCRRRDFRFLCLLLHVMNEVRREKVAVVYTSRSEHLYLQIALLLNIRHTPIIYGIHDVQPHSGARPRSLPVRMGWYLLFKFGQYFVTFSQNQYRLFQQLHPNRQCYMVGLSVKDFGQSTLPLPDKNKGTRLLMFGSMCMYKGYDLLIDAFERLVSGRDFGNMKLSMYGSAEPSHAKWIETHAVHKTNYDLHLEFICNDIIKDLYSTHHFAVMPYRDATQSGPLMIAISYGVPVIAPDFGIFHDTLTWNDAILYNPDDQDGLYNALRRAASMSQKDYEQMRAQCLILKNKYSEESIGLNYIKAIAEVLSVGKITSVSK